LFAVISNSSPSLVRVLKFCMWRSSGAKLRGNLYPTMAFALTMRVSL
jgi:hypothetical protein